MKRRTDLVVLTLVISFVVVVLNLRRPSRDLSAPESSDKSLTDGASAVPSDKNLVGSSDPSSSGQRSVAAAPNSGTRELTEEEIARVRAADAEQRAAQIADRGAREKKLDLLSRNPKALRISGGLRNYVTLPGAFAVIDSQAKEIAGYQSWQKQNGYSFFELQNGQVVPRSGRPVVRIEGTENVAVLTGAFSVKYRSARVIGELSSRYGLNHVQTFDQLQLSYLQSDKNSAEELVQILNQLRSDPRVESADLEMVDKQYVTR